MKFQGQTVIVTGGAGGIGAAISRQFADAGARVIVADISEDAARKTAATLPDDAVGFGVDAASTGSIHDFVHRVATEVGPIHVLVNNAGLFDMQPLLQVSEQSYDRLFAVNTRGLFFMLQAVARQMIADSVPGTIINMASQAGRRGEAPSPVYAATKAAVISLTQSAALTLIDHGIRVNAVAPGVIDTDMWRKIDQLYASQYGMTPGEKTRQVVEQIPARRLAQPAEVAAVACFLASSDSSYMVGQTLNVDGGNVFS